MKNKILIILSLLLSISTVTFFENNIAKADSSSMLVGPYQKKIGDPYKKWSAFRRVSDNAYGPGTITSNKTTTFTLSVTGSAKQYFSTTASGSVASQIGYTLNIASKKRGYMGFRTLYQYQKYSVCSKYVALFGKCNSSWSTVTQGKPLYGEYKIIYIQ